MNKSEIISKIHIISIWYLIFGWIFQKSRSIPTNKYDFKLDYIFTERGIITSKQ